MTSPWHSMRVLECFLKPMRALNKFIKQVRKQNKVQDPIQKIYLTNSKFLTKHKQMTFETIISMCVNKEEQKSSILELMPWDKILKLKAQQE